MAGSPTVEIVEVAPRDGFQALSEYIATEAKIDLVAKLHSAGLRRIEVTAFVSEKAVPQFADAAAVLDAVRLFPDLKAQVLVANGRHAQRAIDAGATHLAFLVSLSETHNRKNIRRQRRESLEDIMSAVAELPDGVEARLYVSTAFHCPYEGQMSLEELFGLLDRVFLLKREIEVCLCDTTGQATPDQVATFYRESMARYPAFSAWAYHGHDTYGLGIANVLAAMSTGVRTIDASLSGLGGCPFAPGATGNVATEDVAWTLERMGIATGVDLDALLEAAAHATVLPGAQVGGRVRDAVAASCKRLTDIA